MEKKSDNVKGARSLKHYSNEEEMRANGSAGFDFSQKHSVLGTNRAGGQKVMERWNQWWN